MTQAKHSVMRRAAGHVLHVAVRAWPVESRDWGRALEAEFSVIEAPWEALRWAIGGVLLLARAQWSEFLDWLRRPLGVSAGGASKELLAQPAPRLPRGVTAMLLLAALAVLLAPETREGLHEVAASWGLPGQGWTERELDAMAREAERRGDAETLAFAAMRLPYSPENVRHAERAVALDPKLTWILLDVRKSDIRFTVAEEHIALLKARDPANAFIELLSAERAARQVETGWEKTHPLATFWYSPTRNAKLASDAGWLTAMQRAFAAPRYDSYVQHRYELDRRVVERHGLRMPFALTLVRHVVPNTVNIVAYGDLLMERAAEAQRRGNPRAAEGAYRQALIFGGRMQTGFPSDLDRAVGSGIERRAVEKLKPLLVATGRAEEAARLAATADARFAAITRGVKPCTADRQERALWSALLIHLSAGMIVLAGALSLIAVAILLVRRRGGKMVRLLADAGPAVFLASAVTLLVVYRPIAKAIAVAMATQSGLPSSSQPFLIYMGLHFLPWTTYGGARVSFWAYLTAWVAATMLLAAFSVTLYRRMLRRHVTSPLV